MKIIPCHFCHQQTETVTDYSSWVCRNCKPEVIHHLGYTGKVDMITLLEKNYYYDYIIDTAQIRIYEMGAGKIAVVDQKVNNSQELKTIGDRLINLKAFL